MTANTLPVDSNTRPAEGLFDPTTGNVIAAKAGTVVTTGGGVQYAPAIVNIADPTTPANQLAVNNLGQIAISNFPSIQSIVGTVSIAQFPSIQTVSGSVDVSDRQARQLGHVIVDSGGVGTNTAPGYTVIQDPTSNTHKMTINADGSINVSGTISASNPSVSATGAAIPASATYLGANKSGNITGLALDGSGNLNVNVQAGTITASNPSVGTDGSAIPTSSTLIGASDGTNLQQLLVESSSNRNLRVGLYSGANEATVTGSNALKVDNSAVIQPISGTVTSNAGTGNFTVVQTTGSNLHAVLDSGSTTAITQATASNLNAQVVGSVASAGSNAGNPLKIGGAFNSTQPTVTTGQIVDAQMTARGAQIVATGVDAFAVNASQTGTWNITNVSGTVSLPTGAATSAKQPALGTAGSASSDVITVQGIASMTALTVAQATGSNLHTVVDSGSITANAGTNLNTSLLALETGGNLASIKTYTSAFADTSTSGSVTNDGDVVSIALPGGQATALMQITTSNLNGTLLFEGSPDSGTTYYSTFANQIGTSTIATSVAGTGGSQAAGAWKANVGGFTNFRVRLHPTTSGTATIKIILTQGVHNVAINNATTLGQATSANSAPVVPASDYVSPVKSSRLEIAGQSTSIVNGSSTDLIPSTDVTGYTMAVLQITGTWSMTLQAQQCNDNANFLQTEAINAQTLIATNNLRSTITANGMFIIPLSGRYLRIRATAWVSNASCVGTLELYTTPPPFVQVAMATYLAIGPQSSGGTSDFHLISAANTNSNNVKNGAGQIYGYDFGNSGASDAWVKFYNKATAPTVGTDIVFRTVYVPKGGKASYYSATGISLGTGIGIGITGGAADSDTTAVAASQVTCEVDYN